MARDGEKTELIADAAVAKKSDATKKKSGCGKLKAFVKGVVKHIGLIGLVVAYIFLGGYAFQSLEHENELHYRSQIKNATESILEEMWSKSRGNAELEAWKVDGRKRLKEYEKILHNHFEQGMKQRSDVMDWDLFGATFFAGTVITTIGYGHIAPVTPYGRVVCILYSIVGIPLVLVALANIGKLLTRIIKYLWEFVRRFFYTGQCRKMRRGTHEVFNTARQRLGKGSADPNDSRRLSRVDTLDDEVPVYSVDDEFNLPVWVALLLLILYLFLGATIFSTIHSWTYLDAFYFCFVSISTIGFGDLIPENNLYVVTASIYIFVGLALASMVINVCQEWINQTYETASEKMNRMSSRYGLLRTSSERTSSEPPTPSTEVGPTSLPQANVNVKEIYEKLLLLEGSGRDEEELEEDEERVDEDESRDEIGKDERKNDQIHTREDREESVSTDKEGDDVIKEEQGKSVIREEGREKKRREEQDNKEKGEGVIREDRRDDMNREEAGEVKRENRNHGHQNSVEREEKAESTQMKSASGPPIQDTDLSLLEGTERVAGEVTSDKIFEAAELDGKNVDEVQVIDKKGDDDDDDDEGDEWDDEYEYEIEEVEVDDED